MGGVALPCPAGTYGTQEGLQKLRDCTVCPAGMLLTPAHIVHVQVHFMFCIFSECQFVNSISCKATLINFFLLTCSITLFSRFLLSGRQLTQTQLPVPVPTGIFL